MFHRQKRSYLENDFSCFIVKNAPKSGMITKRKRPARQKHQCKLMIIALKDGRYEECVASFFVNGFHKQGKPSFYSSFLIL